MLLHRPLVRRSHVLVDESDTVLQFRKIFFVFTEIKTTRSMRKCVPMWSWWLSWRGILDVHSGSRCGLGGCRGQAYSTYPQVWPVRYWCFPLPCILDVCSGFPRPGIHDVWSGVPCAVLVVVAAMHTLRMLRCGPMRSWWFPRPVILIRMLSCGIVRS